MSKSNDNEASKAERGKWSHPLDFLISCLGYAVGLGNIWRFPFLCFKHGGGSFLIPYFSMLFLVGIPTLLLEMFIGQYAGIGPIKLFERLAPITKGLGFSLVSLGLLCAFFYNVLVAWSIWYLYDSLTIYELPWSVCGHWYNTENCVDIEDYYSKHNATYHSSVEEYFSEYLLSGSSNADWYNFGAPNWRSVLCLTIAWAIVGLCLIKGIKSSGKIVYITTLSPYVLLIILAIRAMFLPGATNGLYYYIAPKWERLLDPEIWTDAATQIVYTLGVACGCIITLSSYNDFERNCQRDTILIGLLNALTSTFSGLVVFAILGYMANVRNVEIDKVVKGGPGLAFITYPEVVTKMPVSALWSCLFFIMLINLALGSIFGVYETVITSITDQWPHLRRKKPYVVGITSFAMVIFGLSFTAPGGIHMFNLVNSSVPSWNLLLFVLIETIIVGWAYGADRIIENMRREMKIEVSNCLRAYWIICWKFATPSILFTLLTASWINFGKVRYDDYVYPLWVQILGYLITASTVIWLPLFAIDVFRKRKSDTLLLKPTSDWGRFHTSYGGVETPKGSQKS